MNEKTKINPTYLYLAYGTIVLIAIVVTYITTK
jgi:hypothetical protein